MTSRSRATHHLFVLAAVTLALGIGSSGPGRAAPPKLAADVCAACHGANGNSTAGTFPKLAGQKASYLSLQLKAFRSGARPSSVMQPLAAGLTDTQIAELASFFASQSRAPEKHSVPSDVQLGAAIFRRGVRGTQACALCHAPSASGGGMMGGGMMGGGMMMMRTSPAVTPNLFAQHADYLVRQLDSFADGTRPSKVMAPIAAQLSPADRKSVADYLASVR